MGKSKSRIFRKGINDQFTRMTRESAVTEVAKFLEARNITEAHSLITMFGLTAEEILEAGASYESVVAMKNIFEG
jgi:hypothetical protein